ncbi:MAG: ABC transporter ATP-binding protein [Parvibaculaceae bacterium]
MTQALVRLRKLSKAYGESIAVHPLDLDIAQGDFLAVLGPSGCGKTTLLRMMGGFAEPSTGTIEIAGRDVTQTGPEKRPTNMVFQGYGLFPHMNVRQNVSYGLKLRAVAPDEIRARVADMLVLVHLEELAERPVNELSGGQQQRVALARALVMRPAVLLLDEPLAALDLKLRKQMQAELRRIHRSLGGTFVFVTHDQEEALGLANRIAVMEAGKIVQQGDPQQIYRQPASRFVSTFIGDANLLEGRRERGVVRLGCGASFTSAGADGAVNVIIRPEALRLNGTGRVHGKVVDSVFLGAFTKVVVVLDDGKEIAVHIPEGLPAALPEAGERVGLSWNDAAMRCLDAT